MRSCDNNGHHAVNNGHHAVNNGHHADNNGHHFVDAMNEKRQKCTTVVRETTFQCRADRDVLVM